MLFVSGHENAQLEIKYCLEAQFTPKNDHDWANEKLKLSAFRTEMRVYIYKPILISPTLDLKFTIQDGVGGFLGIGRKRCVTKVTVDRNQYYIGDTIKVKFECDNSQVSKPVKELKIKLCRTHVALDGVGVFARKTSHWSYISTIRAPGCPAHTAV
jgi:hypothetical protein